MKATGVPDHVKLMHQMTLLLKGPKDARESSEDGTRSTYRYPQATTCDLTTNR